MCVRFQAAISEKQCDSNPVAFCIYEVAFICSIYLQVLWPVQNIKMTTKPPFFSLWFVKYCFNYTATVTEVAHDTAVRLKEFHSVPQFS